MCNAGSTIRLIVSSLLLALGLNPYRHSDLWHGDFGTRHMSEAVYGTTRTSAGGSPESSMGHCNYWHRPWGRCRGIQLGTMGRSDLFIEPADAQVQQVEP